MMDNYAVFRTFMGVDQATELASFLKENQIEYKLADNSPPVDLTFTGNTLQNEVQVLIKQEDFERANELLRADADKLLDGVDKDYYLFDFTNEELYEILIRPDEWGAFDYELAQQILKDRGKEVNDDLIQTLRKKRVEDLEKPEEGQRPWIRVGYIFAFLGGLIGIFIGWYLWAYKKTLPDGRKVHAFSDGDRWHGKIIVVLGTFFFLVWVAVRILTETG